MNLDDAATLVAETRAMYPGMSIVPGIVDAWHSVLHTFELDDCRLALTSYASAETRIPVPADVRRLCLASRQDQAMRTLPPSPHDLIPMPDWFHATVAEHRRRQHALNVERKSAGLLPTFGETVRTRADGMPR